MSAPAHPPAPGVPRGSGGVPQGGGGVPQGGPGVPQGSGGVPRGSGGVPQGSGSVPQGGPGVPQGSGGVPPSEPDVPEGGARVPGPITRIEVTRLVKTFGATVALRGVDATFRAGRLTLVEGANGSGKSTLLGILGTLVRPTAGHVEYTPLGPDRARARRHIGWLSHETLAYPDLSGRQNIELYARLCGVEIAAGWPRVAERFELGPFVDRPLRTCSRGQKQRVALARALVHEPAVVLLDEPTTGLDKAGVARLLSIVDGEVARGALVIVVSHEPELFRERAAARVVLERGRVKEQSER